MKRDPADALCDFLHKQIKGWAIEWNLDKYTVIGVLEEIKNEIIWSDGPGNIVELCEDDDYDDDEDEDDDE
jgi:hypothetical protein